MEIDILSLFPDYFLGPFNESIIKQAIKKNLLSIRQVNIRDFSEDKHHKVDDRPYGGGPGMVLMPEPVTKALNSVRRPESKLIYLSPQGTLLTAKKAQELAQHQHLVLLCGHYEGIDQRVIDKEVDEQISIGDFVLTNGALAAIVLVDSVIRFIPGVLGHEMAAKQDSFANFLLDHPHYTRPEVFDQMMVPEVLLEGNHEKIEQWRLIEALKRTRTARPDLYLAYLESQRQNNYLTESRVPVQKMVVTLPVNNIKKSQKFYKKIFQLFDFVDIHFVPTEMDLSKKQQPTFELSISEESTIYFIAAQLKNTEYLIQHTQNTVSFCDHDGYLWNIIQTKDFE